VLIAQLATAAGARAPLAHTANQIFLDLVHELKDQGLRNKVIADMFGLSLRTYHNKIARLSESSTDRGRSLWEALLGFVEERGAVTRVEVLARFSGDDEPTVRGVLKDLVESGLLFRSGKGDLTTFRAARAEDAPRDATSSAERVASLVWVAVHRYGPLTRGDLAVHVPAGDDALDSGLSRLVKDQRVKCEERDGKLFYSSAECVIPYGNEAGWEAAVFDHYQAMVTAISTKLRLGKTHAVAGEWVGGSTYGFDVWDGHPQQANVLGFLQATRDRAVALRKSVETFNATHAAPEAGAQHVIAYVGQTLTLPDVEGDEE
jgi:hypothetical protein